MDKASGESRCPAGSAVEMIGGKWKIPVLWHLLAGPKRFSELQRLLAPVTQKVLIQHLRELEADGLVTRTVYERVPPRVDYRLTARGRAIKPAIEALCEWSKGCGLRKKAGPRMSGGRPRRSR